MNLRDKLKRRIFGAPQSYIEGVLDRRLGWDVRDDYAAYLTEYDEPEAEEALYRVASNPDESDDIAESCGEAVAEIWCRRGTLKIDALRKLKRAALVEAVGIISARKPEWLPLLREEGLAGDERQAASNNGMHPTRNSAALIENLEGFEVGGGRVMPGVRCLSVA